MDRNYRKVFAFETEHSVLDDMSEDSEIALHQFLIDFENRPYQWRTYQRTEWYPSTKRIEICGSLDSTTQLVHPVQEEWLVWRTIGSQ